MRERRWESRAAMTFGEVGGLARRLASHGLKPADPEKEIIVYVEEWTVDSPGTIERLSDWPKEDLTMIHRRAAWRGDFFLLVGAYHTVYRRHLASGTYCSVSHPWKMTKPLTTLLPQAMLWIGFRQNHAFVRVRLHTQEVITPEETRADDRRGFWTAERKSAFEEAAGILDLPIRSEIKKGKVVLSTGMPDAALLSSWPDAFGPCQFEFNSPDAHELLVPAGRLAATHGNDPAAVRAYLTGFRNAALDEFGRIEPRPEFAYRASLHARLEELPEIIGRILPDGRLYATLCEFQTEAAFPIGLPARASSENKPVRGSAARGAGFGGIGGPFPASSARAPNYNGAWVIIGIVGAKPADGSDRPFRIEARLNRAPLPEEEMAPWLEALIGIPFAYAPLGPYP